MWKKGLDIFLTLHLPKHMQYPQLTMIWWICVLISDVVIIICFYLKGCVVRSIFFLNPTIQICIFAQSGLKHIQFGQIYKFGWWDLERISADVGTKFTSTEFKEECQTCGFCLTLAAPEHQYMNGKVEVTRRKLRTVAHSLMVHARVSEAHINFALMYTTDHIFRFYQSKIW